MLLTGGGVLASFDDGSAALLTNAVGQGRAYLLGLSLVDVVLRKFRTPGLRGERHYVNAFSEPARTYGCMILRAWYESLRKRLGF